MQANLRRYSMPSAGIYDLVTGWLFRGRYEAIARELAADLAPDVALLDAGCGPGEVAVRLARLAPTVAVTGLDVDGPMIERARRKARKAGVSPTFVVADVATMPFADASFDVVISSFSVHHWPDPHAGLGEVLRVLRPGGRAIIWDIVDPMELIAARDSAAAAGGPTGPDGGHGPVIVHVGAAGPGGPSRREPASGHGPASGHRGSQGPRPMTGPSWLLALRMLRQFRRMTPLRFEYRKDEDGSPSRVDRVA